MPPKTKSKDTSKSNDEICNVDALYLARVVRAIEYMKLEEGCTTNMIINHLKSVRSSPRLNETGDRLVTEVRRALRIGVHTGLLKERAGGKYVFVSNRKTGKNKNPQGGKRRRSPSDSRSRSTTADEESDSTSQSRSSYDDDSGSERSHKRTRKHRRKQEPKKKRKNKHKHRPRSASSSKSRSRSEQKKTESEPPDAASNEKQNKQEQQQTDMETLPRIHHFQRHKRAKPNNKGWHNQQMDEAEGSNAQNDSGLDEISEDGNSECLCNLNQERRQPSSDPDGEAEPEPEGSKERVNDYTV